MIIYCIIKPFAPIYIYRNIVMSTYTIRQMSINDYQQALHLWENTESIGISDADSSVAIEDFIQSNSDLCFIAEDSGILIGTVLCGSDGRRAYIYHLAVAETHRRNDIGKNLLNAVYLSLKQRNITKCHLFVFSDNIDAKEFYKKTGWIKRTDIEVYSKSL
jgi:N-acetylglutamate synthase